MKKALSIIVLLFLVLSARAQDVKNQLNPIYHGANSHAIAPDARAGGMGDVGVATDPDVNSQYWNPAKYPFCISRSGVALNYTPWLRQITPDIDLANITGYYRLGDYDALSGSLRYFSLGEVAESLDDDANTFKPYELAVDVAYSRMLSETFSAGVSLRFIYSDLAYKGEGSDALKPASAFAADIAFYHNGYLNLGGHESQLGWGLNISNVGSKLSYDEGNTTEFIPTNLRLGTSLLVPFDEYNTLSISADANKLLVPTRPTMDQYVDHMVKTEGGEAKDYEKDYGGYRTWLEGEGYFNVSPISGIFKSFHDAPNGFKEEMQEIQWSVGLEYAYNNQFFLRGGYHYEHPNKGNRTYWTVGAGFKMNVFSLDAGYVISTAQSNPLDQTLRFSLAFDMDGIADLLGKRRR
ncbi:MAG: type IX secretion system outer membrane channel protein PorV [Bacteroidaceae bacterium]|nr:type IX secretion system outer membrane channel protein PorV [Bacteroidaceae bacterium]